MNTFFMLFYSLAVLGYMLYMAYEKYFNSRNFEAFITNTRDLGGTDYAGAEGRDESMLPFTETDTTTKPQSIDLSRGVDVAADKVSQGELLCRKVVHNLYPDCLIRYGVRGLTDLCSPLTGRDLELDILIVDEKIAIEYNGRQHYDQGFDESDPLALVNSPGKNTQQYRDQVKAKWCVKHGILLISIPYTCKTESAITQFILESTAF